MYKDTFKYESLNTAVRQVMSGKVEEAAEKVLPVPTEEVAVEEVVESIETTAAEDIQEVAADLDAANADKALKHDCATHVEHAEYGAGRCIPGMHTLVDVTEDTGLVTHYDVMFEGTDGPFIVENVPVTEMKVTKEMNHGHPKKKK